MPYSQTRDSEQLSKLDIEIGDFISRYSSNVSASRRKTIILFPGGMGSHLLRARSDVSSGSPFFYDTVWLDCSILFGAGLYLEMQNDIDLDEHIIIPKGPVEFMTVRPYDGFIQWCDSNQLDYFIFGWDWRRDMCLTANFFLKKFLPYFRKRVQKACGADPLRHFSLVGHSMGGMVVKLIANRNGNPYVQAMEQAITVATPFYGYGGALPRYFVGEPDLEFRYSRTQLVRIISSFPGTYALLFLDEATFGRDGAVLCADPEFPLQQYPILDATAAAVADPYNPLTNADKVRYPENYGFDVVALKRGMRVYQQIAAPLDLSINNKFFNFRGVQVADGAVVNDTVNSQTWGWIDPNFDPETDASPITDYLGPGDGTLPAWSTRLVTTPPANIRTLRGAIDHMSMMGDPQVLNELAMVI